MKLHVHSKDGSVMKLEGDLRWEVHRGGILSIQDSTGTLATFAAGAWLYVFIAPPDA